MNRWFDFTDRQLRFLALLCVTATVMAGYLFVRSFAFPVQNKRIADLSPLNEGESRANVPLLNPNTAPADSLELLAGIGPVLAARIIEYRRQSPFVNEADVMNVPGIGDATYSKIAPYLKVP